MFDLMFDLIFIFIIIYMHDLLNKDQICVFIISFGW